MKYQRKKIQGAAAGRHAKGHYTQFLDEDKERGEGEDSGPDVSLPDSRLIVWEVKRPKLCALPKYPSDGGSKHGQKDWYIEKLTNAMKPKGLT